MKATNVLDLGEEKVFCYRRAFHPENGAVVVSQYFGYHGPYPMSSFDNLDEEKEYFGFPCKIDGTPIPASEGGQDWYPWWCDTEVPTKHAVLAKECMDP